MLLGTYFTFVKYFQIFSNIFQESKCMLGTYFTFVLLLFILLLTGGILAYSGDLKSTIKTPLLKWEHVLLLT